MNARPPKYASVVLEREDHVATVSLNRPEKLNAMNRILIAELIDALRFANRDPDIHAIALRGMGRAFCAGDDLDELKAQDFTEAALEASLADLQHVTRQLMLQGKPTICAVQGWAVGGAFSWVLNCDVALWGEGAVGFLPEMRHGLFASGAATFLLPARAGHGWALDVMTSSRKLDAREMMEKSLIARVVPDRDLDNALAEDAKRLAAFPPAAMRAYKNALIAPIRGAIEQALEIELQECRRVILALRARGDV